MEPPQIGQAGIQLTLPMVLWIMELIGTWLIILILGWIQQMALTSLTELTIPKSVTIPG